jgi:hypothetical protein
MKEFWKGRFQKQKWTILCFLLLGSCTAFSSSPSYRKLRDLFSSLWSILYLFLFSHPKCHELYYSTCCDKKKKGWGVGEKPDSGCKRFVFYEI